MDRRVLMTLVGAFLLTSTSLAYIIFYSPPPSFDYSGRCLGTIIKKDGTYALVYTLQDINIPGERFGGYIRVIATPEIIKKIKENNLLFWTDADVNIYVKDHSYIVSAFVLPERNEGDEVLLDCTLSVRRGYLAGFFGIETVTSIQSS